MAKPMQAQPLPVGRNYYPKPIPASVLLEESNVNQGTSYSSRAIYEWNIDT